MEWTRDFTVTVEVRRETNKTTYCELAHFGSYGTAIAWLRSQAGEAAPKPARRRAANARALPAGGDGEPDTPARKL